MARLPTAAGVLLGLSLCAHLAAIVQWAYREPTGAATLFLVGQAALAFALIRLIDGAWVFQDIRLLFVIFFFLYGATLPLLVMFGGQNSPGASGAAFLYGTGFAGFNLVQWWHKQPWVDISAEAFGRIKPTVANLGIFVGVFVFVIAYAYSRGLRLAFSIDRTQLRFLGTQLWVIAQFVMNGVTMFMFAGWSRLRRRSRFVVASIVVAYVLIQLSFGNRRDFLPILVFLAGLIATKRHAVIRFGTLAIGFLAFSFFLLIGLVRQIILYPNLLAKDPLQLLLESNEFVSPIQTLMYYAANNRDLHWGWTYLHAPALFIPRAIWHDKPVSLSVEFLRDAFGYDQLMGYAYTPVTEAFINFGWVGPFIVFSVLSLIMVKLVRNADIHPGLYFVAFAMVVDFNRGDFGGIFYTAVVMAGAYAGMQFVSKLKWVRPRSRMRESLLDGYVARPSSS